jgi:hypothetical protein
METDMRRRILLSAVVSAGLAVAASGYGMPAAAQSSDSSGPRPGMMGGYGYGMGPGMMGGGGGMGPGMMGQGMMGQGMMGFGMMGPGMMGPGWDQQQIDLDLSVAEVKKYFERWIALSGNTHVKVGSVTAKDTDAISAEILTTDKDGLVQRYSVDRHTGVFRPEG